MTVFQDGMLSGGRTSRHTGPGKGRGGTMRGFPAAWTLSSAEEQLETSGGQVRLLQCPLGGAQVHALLNPHAQPVPTKVGRRACLKCHRAGVETRRAVVHRKRPQAPLVRIRPARLRPCYAW